MQKVYKILAINPGSTSTKISLFNNYNEVLSINIHHSTENLKNHAGMKAQEVFRYNAILKFLKINNISIDSINIIVGRGGFLKPLSSGTYNINQKMLEDLYTCKYGTHASNLGAILAKKLAQQNRIPTFIVDPIVVDELDDLAKITGWPEIKRQSIFHALNQKSVAKRYASSKNKKYEDINLVVAHLGGGITVACHKQGKVVEVNNGANGDGPFSPERAGTLPAFQLVQYVLNNGLTIDDVTKKLAGKGGLVAHTGINDVRILEERIFKGAPDIKILYNAMIYNIAKSIGSTSIAAKGKIECIILTGGLAHSKYLTQQIEEYVSFLAPIIIIPGENEMQALADGSLRVIFGLEKALEYI